MPTGAIRSNSRSSYPVYATTQDHLIIDSAPGIYANNKNIVGQRLIDAGALDVAGVYRCIILTDALTNIDILLKPSAVTGVATLTGAARLMANGVELMEAVTAGVAFVAGTAQTISLTNIRGVCKVAVDITVSGGGSVTFAAGTTPSAQTGWGEYHGL